MKKITLLLTIIFVTVLFSSCTKKKGCTDPLSINYDSEAEKDDGTCEYAGTGGNFTIVAFPKHHGNSIVSDSAYLDSAFVKFNTSNLPGTNPSDFDLIVVGETGEDHIHIENLKKGKYFIYMTGYDPSISQRVFGGIPYTVTSNTGEAELDVPVSED